MNSVFEDGVSHIGIEDIKSLLAHRYPFLLVDRVTEVDLQNDTITGVKCITYNEPQFTGHFPHISIMPGVLLVEASAQVSGILWMLKEKSKQEFLLAKVDEARFVVPIVPGDRIQMKSKIIKFNSRIGKFETKIFVEKKLCSEITITLSRYKG